MNTHPLAEARPVVSAPTLLALLAAPLRALAARWRAAEERAQFAALGERTLRDIGMSRSEYDSYIAEVQGRAQRTRRNLPRSVRGRQTGLGASAGSER